jgi:hypothetical protein
MKTELETIPNQELKTAEVEGDDWMLVSPTKDCVLITQDGETVPLMFTSEAMALKFKATHAVPPEFIPTKVRSLTSH